MHGLAEMFSLKDHPSQIDLEHCFRKFGIYSSLMRKLSQGIDGTVPEVSVDRGCDTVVSGFTYMRWSHPGPFPASSNSPG